MTSPPTPGSPTTPREQALLDQTLVLMNQGFDPAAGLRPFGAIVARGDQVISSGINSCIRDQDPTAHAEINAIRHACKVLGRTDLSDCVMYASAQPCPMCLAACFHAGLQHIHCITTWQDYADLFPDQECGDWMHNSAAGSQVTSTSHRQRGIALWDRYRRSLETQAEQNQHPEQP